MLINTLTLPSQKCILFHADWKQTEQQSRYGHHVLYLYLNFYKDNTKTLNQQLIMKNKMLNILCYTFCFTATHQHHADSNNIESNKLDDSFDKSKMLFHVTIFGNMLNKFFDYRQCLLLSDKSNDPKQVYCCQLSTTASRTQGQQVACCFNTLMWT